MGAKPVHALASLILAGVSLTGCQSDRSSGGGPYGAPPVIGSGVPYNQPNVVGSRPQSGAPVAGRYDMPAGAQPMTNASAYPGSSATSGSYPSSGSVNNAGYTQMPAGGGSPMTGTSTMSATPVSSTQAYPVPTSGYSGGSPSVQPVQQPVPSGYSTGSSVSEMPVRPTVSSGYTTTTQPAPGASSGNWNSVPGQSQPQPRTQPVSGYSNDQ